MFIKTSFCDNLYSSQPLIRCSEQKLFASVSYINRNHLSSTKCACSIQIITFTFLSQTNEHHTQSCIMTYRRKQTRISGVDTKESKGYAIPSSLMDLWKNIFHYSKLCVKYSNINDSHGLGSLQFIFRSNQVRRKFFSRSKR